MPAKFDRCVKHLRDQGASMDKAFAICQVSVNKAKVRNPGGEEKKPAQSKRDTSPKVESESTMEKE
jgi:hypothetical protein